MKKLLVLALVIMMVLPLIPASAESANQLIVGTTTELSGDFFTVMWGNNAADRSIKDLLHGYENIVWTRTDGYQVNNTVVTEFSTELDAEGNKTYFFTIAEDLVYSDGSPITAKDYVFAQLLTTAPEATAVGADTSAGIELLGYDAFNKGESEVFSGVHLLGDYKLSVTVKAEYVPYYYELTLVQLFPYPYKVIAPGCDIADDGQGAYISGEFTSALLEKTLLDPETGYRFNPQVTSGPYVLNTFDKVNMQAVLKLNPLFKGNYEGLKPTIETVILKKTLQNTQMDELRAGTVDLLSTVTAGDEITMGLDIAEEGLAEYVTYLRNGFGFFTFACEEGHPTADVHVRRAIGYCIDVPEFARAFTKGYGQVVYGYYGAAQWMAKMYKTELAEKLNPYALNLDAAKAELVEGGWIYNEKGEEFVEGTDTLRYKKAEDGTLIPCLIKWASTVDNSVSDLLLQMLPDNMAAVGMKIEQSTMQFAELLEYYYQPNRPDVPNGRNGYDMFNLATNFTPVFDPLYYYHTDDRYLGVNNTSGLKDEELTRIAQEMRNLDSSETEKYAELWFQWQTRWNDLLPTVPLYSNEYFDFFNPKLKGLNTDPLWYWTYDIYYLTIE